MFEVLKIAGEFHPKFVFVFARNGNMTIVDVGSDSDAPFPVLVPLMGAKNLMVGTGRLCWRC
jgi:hypothetical protein